MENKKENTTKKKIIFIIKVIFTIMLICAIPFLIKEVNGKYAVIVEETEPDALSMDNPIKDRPSVIERSKSDDFSMDDPYRQHIHERAIQRQEIKALLNASVQDFVDQKFISFDSTTAQEYLKQYNQYVNSPAFSWQLRLPISYNQWQNMIPALSSYTQQFPLCSTKLRDVVSSKNNKSVMLFIQCIADYEHLRALEN